MTVSYLQITGIDPIVARDGRPFGDGTGNRMRGLPWPLPSAVAGSARRAMVVAQPGRQFDEPTMQQLLEAEVAGVFPVVDETLYLPAPKNCAWHNDKERRIDQLYRAIPQVIREGDGCDLPSGLRPVMLDDNVAEDFKPERVPAWWPVHKLAEWLTGAPVRSGHEWFSSATFLNAAQQGTRDRLAIEPTTGAAEESKLFTVSDLTISHLPKYSPEKNTNPGDAAVTLTCRVTSGSFTEQLNLIHPFGGNRRLAHWQTSSTSNSLWDCPALVTSRLADANHVCLMLATPAIFTRGYLPGWLNEDLQGQPPGDTGVTLKLVGVQCERWKALSRFSQVPGERGPRPLRRMVPAGSMYFFEVVAGDPATLANLWLKPISDDEHERRDGFGLALWGTW